MAISIGYDVGGNFGSASNPNRTPHVWVPPLSLSRNTCREKSYGLYFFWIVKPLSPFANWCVFRKRGGSSSSGSMGVENKAEERDTSMLLLEPHASAIEGSLKLGKHAKLIAMMYLSRVTRVWKPVSARGELVTGFSINVLSPLVNAIACSPFVRRFGQDRNKAFEALASE
eukprot:2818533-Amphidinium_carterae.1